MKKDNPEPLTPELRAELDALAAMPDSEIDTAEMPPITDWSRYAGCRVPPVSILRPGKARCLAKPPSASASSVPHRAQRSVRASAAAP